MFSPHTVFVLGAGASVDFGFPTGNDLRDDIMKTLERDKENYRFLNPSFDKAIKSLCSAEDNERWTDPFERYAQAAVRIRYALPMATSIDNLLHTHKSDVLMVKVGKIAIANIILEKESKSYLCPKDLRYRKNVQLALTNTPNMISSWHVQLMRLLVLGKTLDDVKDIFLNVTFIVFNYDRCLEHFLVNALINYFSLAPDEAAEILNNVNIIHPYGQVGYLKWQSMAASEIVVDYGASHCDITSIAEKILTFTESTAEGIAEKCKQSLANAQTLIFMGFGFLRQNIELLTPSYPTSVERVFMTTKGIGDSDVEIVLSEIRQMISRKPSDQHVGSGTHFKPFIERGVCRDLMDNHWLRLTRG